MKAKEHLRKEEYDQIVDACTEEIDSEGGHAKEARVLRGTLYTLSKRPNEAMRDMDLIVEDDTAAAKLRVNALIKRASLYIQRCQDPIKDPEMAFADFARAVELDKDNADVYHHRGQVYLLTDQVAEAVADFSKAVELNPTFPIAYVQKLYTDYRSATQRQDREAINNVINEFEKAVEQFPKCVETYALYAQVVKIKMFLITSPKTEFFMFQVMSDQAKFDKADEIYQKAQQIDPSNANLFVHRALIALQHKGDLPTAVDLIKEAIKMDEKCEFAYETLGTIEVSVHLVANIINLAYKLAYLGSEGQFARGCDSVQQGHPAGKHRAGDGAPLRTDERRRGAIRGDQASRRDAAERACDGAGHDVKIIEERTYYSNEKFIIPTSPLMRKKTRKWVFFDACGAMNRLTAHVTCVEYRFMQYLILRRGKLCIPFL